METVFNCAIECAQLDDTHNLLVVTALGRIAVYQLAKENGGMNGATSIMLEHCPMGFSLALTLSLIQVDPPLSDPRMPTLPISAHFFNQGHSLMIAHLDSREMYGFPLLLHTVYSA